MIAFTCRRRAVVALAGLAAGSLALMSQPVTAKELKLAHFLPPIHTSHTQLMAPWAAEVGKRTNGELTVKVFPARQLGGTPPGYYKMVTGGIADVGNFAPGYTPGAFPRSEIIEMPVPPEDARHATRILYGLWDKYLAADFKDVKVLAMWTVDEFIAITKTRPIRSLDDMKGLKIRSPSRIQSTIIEQLGAIPVNMPITNVFSAMDTGVVDGLTAGASVVFSFKIADVGRHYTFGTPFSVTHQMLAMNKKVWNGLSAKHKEIIDEISHFDLAMKAASAYDQRYASAIKFLEKKNLDIVRLSPAERQKFQDAAKPVLDNWIADMEKKGHPAKEMWQARLAIK